MVRCGAMEDPHELREKAEHYRRAASLVTDTEISEALLELARGYEAMVEQLLARDARAGSAGQ